MFEAFCPLFHTGVGSEYFVRASNWQETLRLSMEKARDNGPAETSAAYTSPLTSTNFGSQTASSYTVVVNITGWRDLWLVNDYDQSATGDMLVKSWNSTLHSNLLPCLFLVRL
jgi:hypothetical protein